MKNIVDFTSKIKEKFTMRKDIAPVEESSTASRAYSAGDKFYYGNLLQKAITDIAQGASLVGGTNFENADPVTTTIQNLSNNLNKNGSKNIFWHDINSWMKDNKITGYGTFTGNTWERGGVSVTLNDDGTFDVHSTTQSGSPHFTCIYSSANDNIGLVDGETYILSGAGGRNSDEVMVFWIDGVGNELYNNQTYEFVYDKTKTYEIRFVFRSGTPNHDFTYKPMICLKSDYELDPTYTSPAMTNRQLTTDKVGMDLLSEVGAVNYADVGHSPYKTQAVNSCTVSSQSDSSVTLSPTSSWAHLRLYYAIPAGTYKLRFKATASDSFVPFVSIYKDDNNSSLLANMLQPNVDNIITVPNDASYLSIRLYCSDGTSTTRTVTFNDLMITPVSYNGPYVPYAKTNKELTEDVAESYGNYSTAHENITVTYAFYHKIGRITVVSFDITVDTAITDQTAILISGFPKCIENWRCRYQCMSRGGGQYPFQFCIDDSGRIRNGYSVGGIAVGTYQTTFAYITKE